MAMLLQPFRLKELAPVPIVARCGEEPLPRHQLLGARRGCLADNPIAPVEIAAFG